jgi:hypothetical protein
MMPVAMVVVVGVVTRALVAHPCCHLHPVGSQLGVVLRLAVRPPAPMAAAADQASTSMMRL